MPVFSKGSVSFNIGFLKVGTTFTDEDRQCAWQFFTELSTRVAVTGKVLDDENCENFEGELFHESLDSLYTFFKESRSIMKKYPVGSINPNEDHLGFYIYRLLELVIRPFLEQWQGKYRHWLKTKANEKLTPFARQEEFPDIQQFKKDWTEVRKFCRLVRRELIDTYKLTDIDKFITKTN
jgi:hypothetical protein